MQDQVLVQRATETLQRIAKVLLEDNTGAEAFVISAVGGVSYSVSREVMVALIGGKDPGRSIIKGESDAGAEKATDG